MLEVILKFVFRPSVAFTGCGDKPPQQKTEKLVLVQKSEYLIVSLLANKDFAENLYSFVR